MFTANLMKLPLIAAATYFILNIMLFIENKSMTQKVAEGDVIEHVLASAFVTIILSQGLLMAAQAIGVEQIAKMSAAVSSVAKKG
ncbi:MAG TPA: hypothetical protein P5052_03590 [Candidatus Paceibacterota bacterium]|nr:hypothetical protein [Candidatus Paceibacterota bacterium]